MCFTHFCHDFPQVQQLDSSSAQNIETVGTLYVMKSRKLKDAVVDSVYKSKGVGAQQKEDLFPQVRHAINSNIITGKKIYHSKNK